MPSSLNPDWYLVLLRHLCSTLFLLLNLCSKLGSATIFMQLAWFCYCIYTLGLVLLSKHWAWFCHCIYAVKLVLYGIYAVCFVISLYLCTELDFVTIYIWSRLGSVMSSMHWAWFCYYIYAVSLFLLLYLCTELCFVTVVKQWAWFFYHIYAISLDMLLYVTISMHWA